MKVLRKRAGITQVELARIVGMSPAYVALMEEGCFQPPKGVQLELQQILQQPYESLICVATKEEIKELHQLERARRVATGMQGGFATFVKHGKEHLAEIGKAGGRKSGEIRVQTEKVGGYPRSSSGIPHNRGIVSINSYRNLSKRKKKRRKARTRKHPYRFDLDTNFNP
jgi:transcriptional regulator with XRE-family HTH domain